MSRDASLAVVLNDVLDVLWAVRSYLPETPLGRHDREAVDRVYKRGEALLKEARTPKDVPVQATAPDNAAMLERHGTDVGAPTVPPLLPFDPHTWAFRDAVEKIAQGHSTGSNRITGAQAVGIAADVANLIEKLGKG